VILMASVGGKPENVKLWSEIGTSEMAERRWEEKAEGKGLNGNIQHSTSNQRVVARLPLNHWQTTGDGRLVAYSGDFSAGDIAARYPYPMCWP